MNIGLYQFILFIDYPNVSGKSCECCLGHCQDSVSVENDNETPSPFCTPRGIRNGSCLIG